MRCGDFEAAWLISDAVLQKRAGRPCHDWPRHLQYIWQGQPLSGKRVLVRCYHGLGDTVQFIRFAADLKRIAAEVTVWVQPELIGLLRSVAGIDRLLPLHDGTPDCDFDVDIEVMELPHALRIVRTALPATVPYLHASPLPSVDLNSDRVNVGLIWSAGGWDHRRDVPLAVLEPLIRVGGVNWHVLQQGPARREWPPGYGQFSGSTRLEKLASQMRSLDLVITVDSLPAHLAGALGVRTWTLLRADPDWRWGGSGDTTSWYPSMRLFRQEREGEWEPVVAQVVRTLTTEGKTKKPRTTSAA